MKKLLMGIIASCIFVPLVTQAQFAKPEDAIKYRKSVFSVMGNHFGRLAGMAQGKIPFDAKIAKEDADLIAFIAKYSLRGFISGSDKGETKASPKIWEETSKFEQYGDKLLSEVVKLPQSAGKIDDLKAVVASVGGSCKSCHDDFRLK
ncbi:MAG: cytochrome c [Gammaproteobacteria bacterium]|nr:cytochrome c [Gammaproteobacteria bacterium]